MALFLIISFDKAVRSIFRCYLSIIKTYKY
nr:MAG TPA: hypothetical protein [Caudoviricetes sp.]DAZ03419.1 MAG TPA: hypothetical protein [Caudoviricetes sp.]